MTSTPQQPCAVLILADHDTSAERLLSVLATAGVVDINWSRVTTVEDYLAALRGSPTLILSDDSLSALDPLTALGHLQNQGLNLPFIVVSDTISEEHAVQCLQQGAWNVLNWQTVDRLGPLVERAISAASRRNDEAETRYRAVSELTSDFTYALAVDVGGHLHVEWVAGTVVTIMGYRSTELTRSGIWTSLVYQPDLEAVRTYLAKLLTDKSGEVRSHEARFLARDGQIRWLRLRGRCIWDAAGQRPLRIYGAGQDITSARLAAEQLRFQVHLLDTVGQAVIATDADGIITYWNQYAETLYGWSRVEMLGRRITDIMPVLHECQTAAAGEEMTALAKDDLARGMPQVSELTLRRHDGTTFSALSTTTSILDERGSMAGTVRIFQDITARKEVEAALHAAEERYRSLVEHLPLITYMAIADAPKEEARLLYLSPQIEHILGYSVAEWMNNPTFWKTRLHPDDTTRVLEAVSHFDKTKGSWHAEYRYVARDGHPVWFEEEAVLVRDAAGQPLYTLGMLLDVTARKMMEEALQHRALHDALTGLPNRVLLQDRLAQGLLTVQREHTQAALLLLDLDRFKEVNDTFGHHAGDALLQQVARRLEKALRATDTVARLGGDEFAILLVSTDREGAVRAARTIERALEPPLIIGEQVLQVEGSLGIAVAPEHGTDSETLLRCADVAMYSAKGRAEAFAVYAPEQDTNTPDRRTMVEALRLAIPDGELRLHYQPKVTIATRQVVGMEALVRWERPQHGLVSPDRFIDLAEQTGLIMPLTLWVLEEALRTCYTWHKQGLSLGVAVNLSTRTLQDPALPDTVSTLLQRYAVAAASLTLEITESALMADPLRAHVILTRLSALGVRISIDDFGTGYSSLGALKQLPVDEVKIDQSFVRGMGATSQKDGAIVRSVIELGRNLGLQVVAEGVESNAVWERLVAARCDVVQGFHLSRPMPATEIGRWLAVTAGRAKAWQRPDAR